MMLTVWTAIKVGKSHSSDKPVNIAVILTSDKYLRPELLSKQLG